MIKIIILQLIITFLTATVIIILNRFSEKKIALDKNYAVKELVVFVLSCITIFLLEYYETISYYFIIVIFSILFFRSRYIRKKIQSL